MARDARGGEGRRDALIAASLALMLFAWFAWRIARGIGAGIADNAVFGGDAREILTALERGRYWGLGYHKHPLAVLWALLTVAPPRIAGVRVVAAASASFALAGAVAGTMPFLVGRALGAGRGAALAMTLLFVSCFATLTIFSVLETYAITAAAIGVAAWVLVLLARRPAGAAPLAAGVVAGIAGWANAPAAAVVLLFAGAAWHRAPIERARFARLVALPAGIAVLVMAAPALLLGLVQGFAEQRAETASWASVAHFTDAVILRDYAASALGFAVVAPEALVQCRYPAGALATLAGDPARLLALLGFWGLVGAGAAAAAQDRLWRAPLVAALAAMLAILVFFTWFEPQAALLFASQWLFFLVLIALPGLVRWRGARLAAVPVIALLLWVNAPPLLRSPIGDFDASCPVALRVNGAL